MTSFDNNKYISLTREEIKRRLSLTDKLYLEVGGKLFDDYHAARVLPGFNAENKIKVLEEFKDLTEIILVISSNLIEKRKKRADYNITYEDELFRLMDNFKKKGFKINSVVITLFDGQEKSLNLKKTLESMGIKTYLHYYTKGYPTDVKTIVSEEGYGKNEYIKTNGKIIVVTAPGANSGKLATCLSQLYHENKRHVKVSYAKLETFPVYNLPINHPLNIVYEAATVDLGDKNQIDNYYLEHYKKEAVSYNRDLEVFPVLKKIIDEIFQKELFYSPTDVGINMIGFAISNMEDVKTASKKEIVRRYFKEKVLLKKGESKPERVNNLKLMMNKLNIDENYLPGREMVVNSKEEMGLDYAVIDYKGKLITGKGSKLLTPLSAMILNVLKYSAKIPDEINLLPENMLKSVQSLKRNKDKSLSLNEILIIMALSSVTNPGAKEALDKLNKLKSSFVHTTYILSENEKNTLISLGINFTEEDEFYKYN